MYACTQDPTGHVGCRCPITSCPTTSLHHSVTARGPCPTASFVAHQQQHRWLPWYIATSSCACAAGVGVGAALARLGPLPTTWVLTHTHPDTHFFEGFCFVQQPAACCSSQEGCSHHLNTHVHKHNTPSSCCGPAHRGCTTTCSPPHASKAAPRSSSKLHAYNTRASTTAATPAAAAGCHAAPVESGACSC
jgi:hypothetical protein